MNITQKLQKYEELMQEAQYLMMDIKQDYENGLKAEIEESLDQNYDLDLAAFAKDMEKVFSSTTYLRDNIIDFNGYRMMLDNYYLIKNHK